MFHWLASQSTNEIQIDPTVFSVVISATILGMMALFTWLVKQVIKMGQIMIRLEDRIVALERETRVVVVGQNAGPPQTS